MGEQKTNNRVKVGTATTNREKAVVASTLRDRAISRGISSQEAGDGALEELRHAVKDKRKPGELGLLKTGGRDSAFYYHPIGERTPQEMDRIARAAGRDMSDRDLEHVIQTQPERPIVAFLKSLKNLFSRNR